MCDMKEKYKILNNIGSSELDLHKVLSQIRVGCEIFLISDVEVYLGNISEECLLSISLYIAEYASDNRIKLCSNLEPHKSDLSKMQLCVELCKRYREEPNEENKIALRDSREQFFSNIKERSESNFFLPVFYSVYHLSYAFYYSKQNENFLKQYCESKCLLSIYYSESSLYFEENTEESLAYQQDLFSSKFIIDFLKSGKHLFMV